MDQLPVSTSSSTTKFNFVCNVQMVPLCLDIDHVERSECKDRICRRTRKTSPRGCRSCRCLNSADRKSSCRKSGQVHLICNHHSLIDRQIVRLILVVVVISLWRGHKRWKTSISPVKDQDTRQHKTAAGSDSRLTLQRHSLLFSFVLFFPPFDFLIHNKDILRFHQTRGFRAAPSASHVHAVNSLSVTFIDIKIAKVTG